MGTAPAPTSAAASSLLAQAVVGIFGLQRGASGSPRACTTHTWYHLQAWGQCSELALTRFLWTVLLNHLINSQELGCQYEERRENTLLSCCAPIKRGPVLPPLSINRSWLQDAVPPTAGSSSALVCHGASRIQAVAAGDWFVLAGCGNGFACPVLASIPFHPCQL